jgi:hypothetical protein
VTAAYTDLTGVREKGNPLFFCVERLGIPHQRKIEHLRGQNFRAERVHTERKETQQYTGQVKSTMWCPIPFTNVSKWCFAGNTG